MKHQIFFLITVLFISGCVTLPKPVDDVYLTEMTEEEAAKLDKIGQDIIVRKQNKDKIEKEIEILKQRIEVTGKEISELEAANELFLEKEKLYSMTDENDKLVELQKEKSKNKIKVNELKANLKYLNAKNNEKNSFLDIEKSELAVKVAELDYEKALIAKTYQLKRAEEFEEDDIIDDAEYKKFLDDQKVNLDENRKKYEKAVKETEKAEEEAKKSGFEVSK